MQKHIYFDEDAAPPVASTSAPAGTQFARCCSTARVDYDFGDPCYVFKVVRSHDGSRLAATLSNNTIKTYSIHGEGLSHAGDVLAHNKTITDASFPLEDAPYALYSSSADGSVRAWDSRSAQQAESFQATKELLCFDVCDNVVAAGAAGGDVLFWDRRTRKALAAFDDMHMDDVTQVRFHAASRRLLTASQDGLVAVHELGGGLDQDDGFVAALNAGTSVEEIGLYGPGQERLWVRTGTESVQLWEWAKAAAPEAAGGDVAFLDLTWEARGGLAAAAARGAGGAGGAAAAAAAFEEVDYLCGCYWDAASGRLFVVAGTNSGAVGFFPIDEAAALSGALPSPAAALGPPPVALRGAHGAVVRSVCCLAPAAADGAAAPLCATGGEDSKLALWTLAPAAGGVGGGGAAPGASDASTGSGSSGPARHRQGGRRAAPY
ncbi:MAG: WD40-repeat-containing domain protein [Monoraphidium minutum]|nr:MAG: WD40-repeat-containing domain protein [Monoraphidium minutum]